MKFKTHNCCDDIVMHTENFADPIEQLKAIYEVLSSQKDLSPENGLVSKALNQLVSYVLEWQSKNALSLDDLKTYSPELLNGLPPLCAKAECEMEKWWCKHIISQKQDIENFWYLENYRNLIDAEIKLLRRPINNIAFLGSGALPLTAILLSKRNPNAKIRCIDNDAQACNLASQLIHTLKLQDKIEICERQAQNFMPLPNEAVICASLLRAEQIYDKFHEHKVSEFIIRDSEQLYQLLYAPALIPQASIYTEKRKTQLSPKRINTSRYFERVEII